MAVNTLIRNNSIPFLPIIDFPRSTKHSIKVTITLRVQLTGYTDTILLVESNAGHIEYLLFLSVCCCTLAKLLIVFGVWTQ